MQTTVITKSKKLPTFIKSHRIFSKFKKLDKIFPTIGLDNCSEGAVKYLNGCGGLAKASVLHTFESYRTYPINPAYQKTLLKAIKNCQNEEFEQNGKIVFPTQLKKLGPTSFAGAWRKCFVSYDGAYYGYNNSHNACRDLYKINTNITKSTRVVFSSSDFKGAWDIATMSMRGIYSCQAWSGSYRYNLIGSMVDPYVGIIYLTNGVKLTKGSKMIFRALVRYVVHSKTHKPALLIERIYPNRHGNSHHLYPDVVHLFTNFLQQKTQNKLPVITEIGAYHIPNSKPVKALPATCSKNDDNYYTDYNDYCRSYRDSGIGYASSYKTYKPKIVL